MTNQNIFLSLHPTPAHAFKPLTIKLKTVIEGGTEGRLFALLLCVSKAYPHTLHSVGAK